MAEPMEPSPLGVTQLNRPVRVLSVIPAGPLPSSMIFIKRLVEGTREAGIDARTFFLASRTCPKTIWQEVRRFRNEIEEFHPDIIHGQFGTVTGFFCALTSRLPLIMTYRGSDLLPEPDTSWLRSLLGRFLSQVTTIRARHIVCVSKGLSKRLWWRKAPISIIPSGVDTKIFNPRSRDEARVELGWGTDEKVVVFNAGKSKMGRLGKRLDLARASVKYAQNMCGEIRLIVFDGEVDPDLIPTYLNAADCCLCTSDYEGSPNIVKEALACNLPVVSVDVGDVRERLTGVSPSKIVDRDPIEIGKALTKILIDRKRSNGAGAIAELSNDIIVSKYISIYYSMVMRRCA